jgi:hypothetical protein
MNVLLATVLLFSVFIDVFVCQLIGKYLFDIYARIDTESFSQRSIFSFEKNEKEKTPEELEANRLLNARQAGRDFGYYVGIAIFIITVIYKGNLVFK